MLKSGWWLALAVLAVAGPAIAGPTVRLLDPERIQELTRKSTVTRGDCVAAAAALALGRKAPADDRQLVKALADREIVTEDDVGNLGATATRGYACLLFKRALGESKSLWATLAPNSQHYAYTHLAYLNLIPPGSSWVSITGPELLSLVSTARRYQAAAAKEGR